MEAAGLLRVLHTLSLEVRQADTYIVGEGPDEECQKHQAEG